MNGKDDKTLSKKIIFIPFYFGFGSNNHTKITQAQQI